MPSTWGVAHKGNPSGAQYVFDGGTPRILTGYARQITSGGVFIFTSGADGCVSATPNSYVSSDILVCTNATGSTFNGIALYDTASGAPCAFATRGVFLLPSAGTVTAGMPVVVMNGINTVKQYVMDGTGSDWPIGRAITPCGSEGFCLVDIWG